MSKNNPIVPKEEGEIQVISKPDVTEPKLYKVVMHNDHYTTMDFVVWVLVSIFQKEYLEAELLMREIHNKGKAVVGIYPLDIALSKIEKVHALARAREYPLRCTYEEA